MAPYAQHVVVCTGKRDWTSRIEDDEAEEDNGFVTRLKALLGRGGKYSDPFNNILITNSSFTRDNGKESSSPGESSTASVYLFPEFTWLPSIPLSQTAIENFVQGFLLPKEARHHHDAHQKEWSLKDNNNTRVIHPVRKPELQEGFSKYRIQSPFVLICGHGGRDRRCGIMGPLLEAEFRRQFQLKDLTSPTSPTDGESTIAITSDPYDLPRSHHVGLISHIGGHKFAGNIIIYIPRGYRPSQGRETRHPLSGKGIWYGRVEPKHIEGIVEETILGGKVIAELFRGGVGDDGEMLRL